MSNLKYFRMDDNWVFSWGVVFAAATAERAVELYEEAYGEKVAAGFPVQIEGALAQEMVAVEGHDEDGGCAWYRVSVGDLLKGLVGRLGSDSEGEVLGPEDTWVDGAIA